MKIFPEGRSFQLFPNFRNIFNNYTSGLLTIPGLGGGTANSEFEVITGFSSNLFGAGEFPFNTLLSSNTSPSLAYYLKNLGYSSHALHNNDATFYSRYKAYKNLGFDIADYPNAYNLFKNEISLPVYSTLSDKEVEYIIENLLSILEEY